MLGRRSLLLFFLQRLKINILRLTILSGTFALALAFAGNDLVNFIGVPVAGFDAYSIARHAGDSTILMEGLNASVPANFLVLMTAGVIMIVTLWTSKKAMHVTETEIRFRRRARARRSTARRSSRAPSYGPP